MCFLFDRWGEVIPLLFVESIANIRVVIISQPTRRYTDDVSMIPELLKLGKYDAILV